MHEMARHSLMPTYSMRQKPGGDRNDSWLQLVRRHRFLSACAHCMHVYDLGLCSHPVLRPAEENGLGKIMKGWVRVGRRGGGGGAWVNAGLCMASEVIVLPV